ncbi:MAG: hypothetical protein QXN04_08720 [Pyrobaculum sp.]
MQDFVLATRQLFSWRRLQNVKRAGLRHSLRLLLAVGERPEVVALGFTVATATSGVLNLKDVQRGA